MNICSNTRGNRGFSAIKIAPLQSVGCLPIPLQRDIYAPRRYLCTAARGAPDEPYVSSYSRACVLSLISRARRGTGRWRRRDRERGEERRSHPPTHHVWSGNESITTWSWRTSESRLADFTVHSDLSSLQFLAKFDVEPLWSANTDFRSMSIFIERNTSKATSHI